MKRRSRAILAAATASAAAIAAAPAWAAPPAPIDKQNWSFQDNLTWADYHALPGTDYSNPDIQPTVKKWKVALVVTDFPDKPFYLTQPAGSSVFGTPTAQANNVPRADVPTRLVPLVTVPIAPPQAPACVMAAFAPTHVQDVSREHSLANVA